MEETNPKEEKKIIRQIRQYKDKWLTRFKKGARIIKKDLKMSPLARFYRKGRIREEGD